MNKADLYHEALSLHRHYDNLSQLSIASLVAVAGATPVAYDKVKDMTFGGSIFLGGAILIWVVLQLYARFDAHAAMCMKFGELIERSGLNIDSPITEGAEGNDNVIHGVAHAFHHRKDFKLLNLRAGGFIFSRIRIICFLCIIIFTITGASLVFYKLKSDYQQSKITYKSSQTNIHRN
ncbi:hypothetical protein [Falsirhodobacter sp. alg1]|uniref:hypothetical protein n=1 Tax=Falsirhodobacter sp. alg1 TaxID=1472418 RepID=UPI00128F6E74|nr:hypothetical protein [Falsirhodobacter sp. alg1]